MERLSPKAAPARPVATRQATQQPASITVNAHPSLDTPEAIAFELMTMALPQSPEGRRELLDLFAECLAAASGARERRLANAWH